GVPRAPGGRLPSGLAAARLSGKLSLILWPARRPRTESRGRRRRPLSERALPVPEPPDTDPLSEGYTFHVPRDRRAACDRVAELERLLADSQGALRPEARRELEAELAARQAEVAAHKTLAGAWILCGRLDELACEVGPAAKEERHAVDLAPAEERRESDDFLLHPLA